MTSVAVIDYGAGNLTSVMRGLRRAGLDPGIAQSAPDIRAARAIVVPGVGHFSATAAITDDVRDAIRERVAAGVPLLGICLGMQWLFEGSTEAPNVPGLGLAHGLCQAIEIGSQFDELTPDLNSLQMENDVGSRFLETTPDVFLPKLKVPHLGWNRIEATPRESRLLHGVDSSAFAYFAHSFAAPVTADTVATTTHGATFASVIERDNIFGAQFHPELSSTTGAAILANFARMAAS